MRTRTRTIIGVSGMALVLSGEASFDGTFRPGTQVEDLAMKLNQL